MGGQATQPGDYTPVDLRLEGHGEYECEGAGCAPPAIPGYTVLRHLGSGAMGDVYEARDDGGRAVALKILAAQGDLARSAARVAREVAALSAVEHANVVRLYAHGTHQGRTWLAMELVAGRDLDAVLAERGTLGEGDTLRVALQVARGLAHVHAAAGIIHRDIKPANLLLVPGAGPDGDDAVKVIDFGLAKAPATDAAMTREGMVVGTPMYMSPEQIRGELAIGPAADIYALGGTMVHLLTGKPPFPGANAYDILRRHLQDPLPDLAALRTGLRPATRQLVAKAMAKETRDRHADWGAFIAEAEAALAHLASGPQPLRLLRVDLAPGTALRLRRECDREPADPFQHELSGRMRRLEHPRQVERLVMCARETTSPPRAQTPTRSATRRAPSPAALALLRAYRVKMLALPATPTPLRIMPAEMADQHLVPIALLLAATAAWLCTWLG